MSKLDLQRASFFAYNKEANEFFFTSNGNAFFKKPHADAEVRNLEDKEIVHVTRAEYDAWNKELKSGKKESAAPVVEDKRTPLEKAQDKVKSDQAALEAAKQAQEAAVAHKGAIAADQNATKEQKSAATSGVTKTTTAVGKATEALEASTKILAELEAVK